MNDDWPLVRVDELLEASIGGVWGSDPGESDVDVTVFRSTDFNADGHLSLEKGARRSVTTSQLASRQMRHGDVLLEKSGGGPNQPVGRVAYVEGAVPEPSVCANFVQFLRPDTNRVVSKYLFYALWADHSNDVTLQFQAQTTGIRNLRTKDYLARHISLPPLPVQRRIVDLMAHLDNQIASLRLERDAGRAVRVATLSTLLDATREIPADYDAAFDLAASAQQASPTSEQTMNDRWPDLAVADVTVMVKRGRAPEYADHGALVVSQKCIQYGNEFSTALARRTDALSKPVPEWAWLLETDTLVNSTGRGTLGRAAYVGRLDEPTTADSHVAIVRPDPRKVVPRFLGIVLSASFTNIESLQSGSTSQTELSPSSLLMMRIPVPPLPVQRRIVDLMAHLDNQIAGMDVEVSTLESLRRQLLASLLSQGVELPTSYDLLLEGVA